MEAHNSRRNVAAGITMAVIGVLAFVVVMFWHVGTRSVYAQETTTVPGCWTTTTDPSLIAPEVSLDGITAVNPGVSISSNEAWAVGSYALANSRSLTLIEHGAGHWDQVESPSPGAFMNTLNAVAAVSEDDVWAVGAYGQTQADSKTLILHWDGYSWSQVNSPSVDAINQLTSVAALSANDVWAVGYHSSGGSEQSLALHWDGTRWSQVPTPGISGPGGHGSGALEGVAGSSATNVWAVGQSDTNEALVIHWDGHSWTQVLLPSMNLSIGLRAVAVLGSDDVWAVGGTFEHGTFALHWNGKTWDTPPTPFPGDYPSSLNSLAAIGPDDIWAAGTVGSSRMLIEHWDGSAWSIVPGTPDARGALANGIAAVRGAADDLWIAGSAIDTATELRQAFLVHRTNVPCTPAPFERPTAPPSPPVPLPGTNSRTFQETGKTVSGEFLDYWNSHGALAQQGYPISNVIGEVSDLDGKLYTVQYFERAVFEYHPENQPPYNVLLSQLGTFEYRQKYQNGAPNQKPNNDPGSVFFPETGYHLGGRFLEYWRSHGGLMQQGYPISDEFQEVSPLNGFTYTVQYFERAVFEYHPENKPPYDVLLSQLGRFQYDSKYVQTPSPTPTPSPTAVQTPILLSASVPYPYVDKLVAGGRYVFWTDIYASPWCIVGYDVDAGRTFTVTQRPLLKGIMATDGRTLAWIERPPNGAPERIRGYEITTGREFPIIESTTERNFVALAIDGNNLYYEELTSGHVGIYAHDVATGTERLISANGKRPVAADGVLLWEVEVPHCSGGLCTSDWDLHMLKSDGTTKVIAKSGGENDFSSYDVSGDNIVWGSGAPESPVSIYSISAGTTRNLGTLAGTNPHIDGSVVGWTGAPSTAPGGESGFSVRAEDMTTGVVQTLVPDSDVHKEVQAVAGESRKAVIYTVENGQDSSASLYLVYVK